MSSGSVYPELLIVIPALADDEHIVPFDDERFLQRLAQPFRDTHRIARVIDVVEQHGEFVAAEPRERESVAAVRHGIVRAQTRLEAVRDFDQQSIRQGQPEAVIHRLEAIEPENHERKLVVGLPRRCG